jgi:hypothetical protein
MAPRCQCNPTCPNKPLKGQAFCKEHKKFCHIRSPLTGYEPTMGEQKYHKSIQMKDSHNCFAYAFDHVEMPDKKLCNDEGCDVPFHQPGRKSGYPKWSKVKGKRCPDLIGRLKGDIPNIQRTTFTRKCPKDSYKIALVIDPKKDYHFYRQDSNGMWSHKPGGTDVTRLDASKRPIYNPELADRDYRKDANLNYSIFCSYLCAPKYKKTFKRGGGFRRTRRGSSRSLTRRRRASE